MHFDFEPNLITHIFRKFGVSRKFGSDVIFALSEAPKEFHTVLSTIHAYQRTYIVFILLRLHCQCLSLAGIKPFIY